MREEELLVPLTPPPLVVVVGFDWIVVPLSVLDNSPFVGFVSLPTLPDEDLV